MGRLRTLLAWHLADPVDRAEQLRNERIFSRYQHTRNPFVDHPEWVALIFAQQPGPRLTVPELTGNGGLSFQILNGIASQSAVVEMSTNLIQWMPVATNVFPATVCPVCPSILFKDSLGTFSRRYYRVSEQ